MTPYETPTQVAADMIEQAATTINLTREVVVHYGAILQTRVRRRASLDREGPPGPRLMTGNYVRSINRRTQHLAFVSTTTVGTDAPQGPRLELGFTGEDSLGRHYDQPPYPHFGPALDETLPEFALAVGEAARPRTRGLAL